MISPSAKAAAPAPAIREMALEDIPAVSALAVSIWRRHYPDIISQEQIEYMLPLGCSADTITKNYIGEKKQRFWLIYAEDTLAGFIAAEPRPGGAWYIDKLYVDVGRQRYGLGRALLAHMIATLHPDILTLRVNRKNYKALNFYFGCGFFIDGLDVLDIGGGFVMDDFVMKKVL